MTHFLMRFQNGQMYLVNMTPQLIGLLRNLILSKLRFSIVMSFPFSRVRHDPRLG